MKDETWRRIVKPSNLNVLSRNLLGRPAIPANIARERGEEFGLQYVGLGASRVVYGIPDTGEVAKIATTDKGIAANIAEWRIWRELEETRPNSERGMTNIKDRFMPVWEIQEDHRWIIQPKCYSDLTPEEYEMAVSGILEDVPHLNEHGELLDRGNVCEYSPNGPGPVYRILDYGQFVPKQLVEYIFRGTIPREVKRVWWK